MDISIIRKKFLTLYPYKSDHLLTLGSVQT